MNWTDLLDEKRLLVADGAWGTELQRRVDDIGEAPERLNADAPDIVAAVARSYVEAGAEIIITNTFGGTRVKLAKAGLAERTAELNRLGVRLSRAAAAGVPLVFASIGPTGEFLEPLGTLTAEAMEEAFAEQIAACVEGGADGILIESMSDLGETTAAIRAARRVCALPVVATMTFSGGPKGYATMMGVTPEQAAAALDAAGADALGANCGAGIEQMAPITAALRGATGKPLWIKSNAGLPELLAGETVFRETPEEMARHFAELVEAGADVVGGCCGTTPEHIGLLVAERDKMV